MKFSRHWFRLATFLFAFAAGTLRAELPPEAQAVMKKGIIAAQQQDYPLALRFFQDARKLAPDAPEVFFNLGLAESKIPSRELRAIAWFGAYLEANPTAPNAAAVKEQIAVLVVKNQSSTSRFLKTVQKVASQLSGFKKEDALIRVATLWAKTGDISAALDTANLNENEDAKSRAYSSVCETQADLGDIAGARKTADLIPNSSSLVVALSAIAEAQGKAGDVVDAKRTIEIALSTLGLIKKNDSGHLLLVIVEAQARSGDIAGAQKTCDLMPDDVCKRQARDFIAKPTPKYGTSFYDFPWLTCLRDTVGNGAPLNSPPFLDLAAHLKSLPTSYKSPGESMRYAKSLEKPDEDKKRFDAIHETAEKLVSAQNTISRMLKKQAKK